MGRENFSKHLYGLFIFICVICLFPVFPMAAEGALPGNSRATTSLTASALAWTPTGSLATMRSVHTATLLTNGKVLVAGGFDGNNPIPSCEIYNPATGVWTETGSLTAWRYYHTATLLSNGQVLVAGGLDQNYITVTDCEIYDPAAGVWTPTTGSMTTGRYSHTTTLLANGKVLVAGGLDTDSNVVSDCEIYDPATGAWTVTGSLATGRYSHTATLLTNGKVLVTGGWDQDSNIFSSCEIYDPSTGMWTTTAKSLATERYSHTATRLTNGKVLVAGGRNLYDILTSSEIYDPSTGVWTATDTLAMARVVHTATLLSSGQVLVTGGYSYQPNVLTSCEIYDPSTGKWTATENLGSARSDHTATLLSDGKVLVAGGVDESYNSLSSCETYDPSTPATIPGAPTGVSATASDAQAKVTFTPPDSNGGSTITSYTVTSSPGGVTATGPESPITVTGLTNGIVYTFTVKATNKIGTGPASAPSNSVTPGAVPGAPTNVTATAGNTQATVSFNLPANGGSPITSYTVTSSPEAITATGAGSPITVPGLTNGIAYTFTVKATNAIGTGLASVKSNSVTPGAVPDAPTNVTASAGNARATVSFTAPASNGGSPITSYTVTCSAGQTASGAASPITMTGLTNGTAYTFTVKATNATGTGPASGPSNSVTPGIVPDAPTNVTATAGNALASVSFKAPANTGGPITSYTVTSSPGGITASGAASPITVPGLTNGTAYTFTVKATNAIGTGPASAQSNSVTPGATPDAPTNVAATAGNAKAKVSFTPPASNGGKPITGYTVTSNPGGIKVKGLVSPITVTGLANGTAYTFTVTATSKMGTGLASDSSNSVTPAKRPGAPTKVTATADNTQATISFTAPASDGGSAITSYTVTSSPGGKTASGAGSPITVTGLTNGTAYTFTVKATNSIGTGPASLPSNSVKPATVPGTPTGVTAKAGNAQATITFKAPASTGGCRITSYTVTSSEGQTASGTASPITVKGLTSGAIYTFTVTATNKMGTGPVSSDSNPVTPQ